VLEAAVVALPDARNGEVPGAAVRLADGATFDAEVLRAFAAERLAAYKVPVRWVAVDELPRTGTEKVKKRELLSRFE
jgi:acyl-coenzyme A synthetase/AMP-(fatty) acid ligase